MAMEFPRGMGAQVEKSWKLQRMGEYREAPLEWKILGGGGGGGPGGKVCWAFGGPPPRKKKKKKKSKQKKNAGGKMGGEGGGGGGRPSWGRVWLFFGTTL